MAELSDTKLLEIFYDKLQFLNSMTEDMVSFAASKYGQEFFEFMDMNCGAVPKGDFSQVIDISAPVEFLDLYTSMVFNRFNLASEKILALGDGYEKILRDYLYGTGKSVGVPAPISADDACSMIDMVVLDGKIGAVDMEVVERDQNHIIWKKNCNFDTLYWKLIPSFIEGLFDGMNVKFSLDENHIFSLYLSKTE